MTTENPAPYPLSYFWLNDLLCLRKGRKIVLSVLAHQYAILKKRKTQSVTAKNLAKILDVNEKAFARSDMTFPLAQLLHQSVVLDFEPTELFFGRDEWLRLVIQRVLIRDCDQCYHGRKILRIDPCANCQYSATNSLALTNYTLNCYNSPFRSEQFGLGFCNELVHADRGRSREQTKRGIFEAANLVRCTMDEWRSDEIQEKERKKEVFEESPVDLSQAVTVATDSSVSEGA